MPELLDGALNGLRNGRRCVVHGFLVFPGEGGESAACRANCAMAVVPLLLAPMDLVDGVGGHPSIIGRLSPSVRVREAKERRRYGWGGNQWNRAS